MLSSLSVLCVCACGCSFIPPQSHPVDSRSTQLIQGLEREGGNWSLGAPDQRFLLLFLISQSSLVCALVQRIVSCFNTWHLPTLFHSQYHLRKNALGTSLVLSRFACTCRSPSPKNKILREKSGTFTLMSPIYVSLPHELCRRSKSSKRMAEEMNCKSTCKGRDRGWRIENGRMWWGGKCSLYFGLFVLLVVVALLWHD